MPFVDAARHSSPLESIPPDRMTGAVWHDEPAPARAPLDGDLTTDVVIIGAGIGGLATAWHLLGHGIRAVVVERRGGGAGGPRRHRRGVPPPPPPPGAETGRGGGGGP